MRLPSRPRAQGNCVHLHPHRKRKGLRCQVQRRREGISNVNILVSVKVNSRKHFVKQFACSADKRFALKILVFAPPNDGSFYRNQYYINNNYAYLAVFNFTPGPIVDEMETLL